MDDDIRQAPGREPDTGPHRTPVPAAASEPRLVIRLGPAAWFVRSHRGRVTGAVILVSMATCVALGGAAGATAVHTRLAHLGWALIPLLFLAHAVAYLGYLSAHHQVLNRRTARPVAWRRSAQITVIGFGAWLIGGGFGIDRRAHLEAGYSAEEAGVGVVVLGGLELLVLTPVAWVCALVLLRHRGLSGVVTVPWLIGVPVGFLLALSAMLLRLTRPGAASRHGHVWLDTLGAGLLATLGLLADWRRGPQAIGGIALYWAADLLALWLALRMCGVSVSPTLLIIGYGTAYVFTRRTLPFAGAPIIEGLLILSLNWVDVPLAPAAIAVLLYRLSDFSLTLAGALVVSSVLEPEFTFLRAEVTRARSGRHGRPG